MNLRSILIHVYLIHVYLIVKLRKICQRTSYKKIENVVILTHQQLSYSYACSVLQLKYFYVIHRDPI